MDRTSPSTTNVNGIKKNYTAIDTAVKPTQVLQTQIPTHRAFGSTIRTKIDATRLSGLQETCMCYTRTIHLYSRHCTYYCMRKVFWENYDTST